MRIAHDIAELEELKQGVQVFPTEPADSPWRSQVIARGLQSRPRHFEHAQHFKFQPR
jgi:hypothetical protein